MSTTSHPLMPFPPARGTTLALLGRKVKAFSTAAMNLSGASIKGCLGELQDPSPGRSRTCWRVLALSGSKRRRGRQSLPSAGGLQADGLLSFLLPPQETATTFHALEGTWPSYEVPRERSRASSILGPATLVEAQGSREQGKQSKMFRRFVMLNILAVQRQHALGGSIPRST